MQILKPGRQAGARFTYFLFYLLQVAFLSLAKVVEREQRNGSGIPVTARWGSSLAPARARFDDSAPALGSKKKIDHRAGFWTIRHTEVRQLEVLGLIEARGKLHGDRQTRPG